MLEHVAQLVGQQSTRRPFLAQIDVLAEGERSRAQRVARLTCVGPSMQPHGVEPFPERRLEIVELFAGQGHTGRVRRDVNALALSQRLRRTLGAP